MGLNMKTIKMKAREACQDFLKLLLMLTLTMQLVTSLDIMKRTSSLRKQKADIYSIKYVGKLPVTNIPELSDFTVCLDLYSQSESAWTLFSCVVENSTQNPELSYSRAEDSLQIFLSGSLYEFQKAIGKRTWYTLCLTWRNVTAQLEAYLNGENLFNASTKRAAFKGKGSLVLGAAHTRKGDAIEAVSGSNFIGFLYNYQMWSYSRTPNELTDCSEGNLISWAKGSWNFQNYIKDEELSCGEQCISNYVDGGLTKSSIIWEVI